MKYTELPDKWKKIAIQNAIDVCNDLYIREGMKVKATENSDDVLQYLEEHDYEVEYVKSIKSERLVVEGLY